MTYVQEYRQMLPEEVRGVVNANGISSREGPTEPWEVDGAPIGNEKTHLTYEDFLYDHARSELLRQWSEINRNHLIFGCSLEPAEDNSWSPCVIHGMYKGERELSKEDFMGSFNEPRGF